MRIILIILVSVLLSVFVMRAWPQKSAVSVQPQASTETTMDRVLKTGVLRCGYAAWEPMLIIDPNTKQISGISHDVMEEVGKKMNLKIEWVEETSWADYPKALDTGRFDAFCVAGWPNSARARVVQFTKPILFSPINVYVKADNARFDGNVAQMNDPAVKFVFIDGTTSQLITKEAFPDGGNDSLPALTPFADLFMHLDTSKADATVMDSATVNRYMKANPDKIKLVPGGERLRVFPNVFAVKRGDYDLQQMLDTVLYELNGLGTIDRIIKQYEPLPGTYYRVSPQYAAQ